MVSAQCSHQSPITRGPLRRTTCKAVVSFSCAFARTGRFRPSKMIRSTGWRDLDKSSTTTFSKWRFRPVGRAAMVKIPVMFTLGIPTGPSHGRGTQRIPHSTPPRSPNQPMKPTAPLRRNLSVFATTPCRGLSLSR
jgi:hypothetical protein